MMKYRFITKDNKEATRLMKSEDMASALFEINQIYHSFKYESLSEEQEKILNEIINRINDILDYHSIIIHELID